MIGEMKMPELNISYSDEEDENEDANDEKKLVIISSINNILVMLGTGLDDDTSQTQIC